MKASRFSTTFAYLLVISFMLSPAEALSLQEQAQDILDATGVEGGLIVHFGCGDGQLTVALHDSNSYYVHGLDKSDANVAAARAYIKLQGLYGDEVMVEQFDGDRLPYIENLVNLLVSEQPLPFDANEILRVLSPNGVAYINDGNDWTMTVKPRPAEIDEWTHYLYDASNNAVSQDSVIAPLRRFQWQGSPMWSRQHDHMASVSVYVAAKGRVFYIIDEGSKASVQLPSKWSLYARDAFNGTILWKKPIAEWMVQMWPLKSGPALLPRRLVAVDDRVYVTLGMDGTGLSCLDAVTGNVLWTKPETIMTEEIIYSDGVLFLSVKDDPNVTGWWDFAGQGKSGVENDFWWDEANRWVTAMDANTGTILWQKAHPVAPLSLAADANGIYFHDSNGIVRLNRTNGNVVWTSAPIPTWQLLPSKFGTTLVLYNDVVLFEGGNTAKTLTALSAQTGDILWTDNHAATGHNCPYDLTVVDDLAWAGAIAGGGHSGEFTGWDPQTGFADPNRQFTPDVDTYWFHHRCYRIKATDKYLLTSRTGIEFVDPRTKHWEIHHWVRGGCLYGILPANGMIYTAPQNCACYLESKMYGFCALTPAHSDPNYPQAPPDVDRLEQGPAYGEPLAPATGPEDWPTYRNDPNRSGYVKSVVPADLAIEWENDLGGNLTAPVIASGQVYLASVDLHTVYALSETDGQLLWSFIAGGRVDSPPSIYKGRAIFGCADGWVYCLRASDGALIWRFQAAPEELKMTSFEQVESVWPLHGSVLILNGSIYCVAGRSCFVDGGMRFLQLDPNTGTKLNEVVLDEVDNTTGEELQSYIVRLQMPVAMKDILSSDGEYIYMHTQRFDLLGNRDEIGGKSYDFDEEGAKQYGVGMHLFSPTGLLDDSYMHRTYWVWGKTWVSGAGGYHRAGAYAPAGRMLAFNDSKIYGFGRKPQYYKWTTPLEYQLFSAEKYPESESIEYEWLQYDLPLLVRSMVLADKILMIAGPPDVFDEEAGDVWWFKDPNKAGYDPNSPNEMIAQDAALNDENGAILRAVSILDGQTVREYNLESMPVWDGMAGANGKLYIVMNNGKVKCFVGTNYPPIIDAGEDQVVYPMAPAILDANITDDGFPKVDPCDPCSAPIGVTTNWVKLEGPGEVSFADPCVIDTNASFSQSGRYTLLLTAFDGGTSYYDDIDIFVCRPGDLDKDNDVDIFDIGLFAEQWLMEQCGEPNEWCHGADQTAGGSVALGDYAIVAANWLAGVEPATPTELVAEPGNNQISLDWDDNTEPDLGGYNVYRSLNPGSGYTKLNGSLLTNSNYLDTSADNLITYYYAVTAEDIYGFESAFSTEISASPGTQPVMKLIAGIGVTTVGVDVSEWQDQANNNNAKQDTADDRPIWLFSAINAQPAVDFYGAGEHLDVADSKDINTGGPYSAKTLIVVFKTSSDIASRQIIWEQGGGTRGLNFYLDSGNLYINGWNLGNDEPQWGPTGLKKPVSAHTAYVATLVMNSGAGTFEGFVNGTSIDSNDTIAELYSHSGDCALGHNEGGSKFHSGGNSSVADFAGQVAEFYCFNSAFSSSDRQTLENFLKAKYGI